MVHATAGQKSQELLAASAGCQKACAAMCSSAPLIFATSPSGEPTNTQVTEQLGIFDIFKIGIGPSSSHTVGPMAAAYRFINEVRDQGVFQQVVSVRCDLFGSLALTGVGHGTDKAVCVGLAGKEPSKVAPDEADAVFDRVREDKKLKFGDDRDIDFCSETHIIFHMDAEMPQHPNGMRLAAFGTDGMEMYFNEYLSVGGGFVKTVAEFEGCDSSPVSTRASSTGSPSMSSFNSAEEGGGLEVLESTEPTEPTTTTKSESSRVVPYPFVSAAQLLILCKDSNQTIAELMMENERMMSCDGDMNKVHERLDSIWQCMSDCIDRGLVMEGVMPVSGNKRQAPGIYKDLRKECERSLSDHFAIMDWIALYARCVNEENACGGRIVTSPTNGASGTLPAVLAYYSKFCHSASKTGIRVFLATAAAFGTLLKTNASISGAEAGCQAEVGSACAMAAAGLTAVLGGSLEQIENAAEIGLEHNLGMTCDPLQGLVQIPCIERNCVAAVKAITAHRLALRGDGSHQVSFDSCVETMYRTGLDMQSKYRETSTGGLALYARRPDFHRKSIDIRKRLNSGIPIQQIKI